MTLWQLADAVETTASFISQLERGFSGANTNTFMKIAGALGVGISDLFENGPASVHKVLSRELRPALPSANGYRKFLLSRRPIQALEVYVGEFGPGSSTGERPYSHGDSHEMFVVLRGEIELTLGEETFEMREGDSIEYPTSTPHMTRNIGKTDAHVMWIIAPPSARVTDLDSYNLGKSLGSGVGQHNGLIKKREDEHDG